MTILHLDDRKVLRRFGKRPELGRIIGGASPSMTVKVSSPRWVIDLMADKKDGTKFIKGHWENETPVLVRCVVALKCVGKGKWKALCQEHHREYVEWWLVTHCGHSKVTYDY